MAVSVGQVEQLIEKIAPLNWAEDWDNPGLLIGDSSGRVEKILLTLDATPEVVEEAVEKKADLIVAHHPLMFKPLKNLRTDNRSGQIPLAIFKNGISFYAAHTNLDQSVFSASLTFAKVLGLQKTDYLQVTAAEKLMKIVTFVPEDSVEEVRLALAAEGVGAGITPGEHGDCYDQCFFQSVGQGMFRALDGAEPAVGSVGGLTRVTEIKLESVFEEKRLSRVLKALHKAHPYEEPAYDLIPLRNSGRNRGYGVIGYLPEAMPLGELWEAFLDRLQNSEPKYLPGEYDFSSVRLAGDPRQKIKKIAILNGSGGSFVPKALFNGADLYITGDIDYHGVLDSLQAGMAVGELGHFLSEIPMIQSLYTYLSEDKTLKDTEILLSVRADNPWKKV